MTTNLFTRLSRDFGELLESSFNHDNKELSEILEFFIASDELLLDEIMIYIQEYLLKNDDIWTTKNSVKVLHMLFQYDSWISHDTASQLSQQKSVRPSFSWNLLYRATEDGFNAVDFHRKCDNK
ncbi:2274_t:CDS:2, partial [Gigaspora rosea]